MYLACPPKIFHLFRFCKISLVLCIYQDNACTKSLVAIAEVVAKVVPEVGGLDEARRIVAIQITNGFEVNLPSMCGRGIYANTSFLNHSCIPNVTHSHRVKLANHNNNNSEKGWKMKKIVKLYKTGFHDFFRFNEIPAIFP